MFKENKSLGFTLIELSTVIVVLGSIFGAVLAVAHTIAHVFGL